MREFFKPWRRRIGFLMLVIACVLMGGWIRSWTIGDAMFISHPNALHAFASKGGTIRWGKQTPGFDDDDSIIEFASIPVQHPVDHDTYWRGDQMEWRWGFSEFDFGAGTSLDKNTTRRMVRWAVPYWSITIPLTALSAFLLLSKPKTSTPKKIDEPISGEGGGDHG